MKNWQSRNDDKQFYDSLLQKRKVATPTYNFECSSSPESRKRHDSDSESQENQNQQQQQLRDDDIKKEMKEALGVGSDSDLSLDREEDELEKQIELLKKQADQYKNAETVYRDASGKQVTLEELQMNTLEMKKIQLLQKNKEIMKEWIFGYKQKLDRDLKNKEIQTLKQEGEKGPDMSEKNRFYDPMIRLIEQDKVQQIEDLSTKLRCRFKAMPNRYQITPGFRWDGVERGNGYELKLFNKITTKKIKTQQAYVDNTKEM